MRPSKTKAMAYAIMPLFASSGAVGRLIAEGRTGNIWVETLANHYMCCEHVPLEEMESKDPATIAEWFMKESRKHHWQMRQMSPLGHLAIIAVGENLYMIHDTYTEEVEHYCETPLKNSPNFTLITLKEEA